MILAAVTLATDSHGENKIDTHQHQMKQEPRETEEENQGKKQNDRLKNHRIDRLWITCNSSISTENSMIWGQGVTHAQNSTQKYCRF